MIRNGAWRRYHSQQERERLKRAQQAQLRERWKPFSLPLQAEVQAHLSLYGLAAAAHATALLERLLHEHQQG